MNLTVLSVATPKTRTRPATFRIVVPVGADLVMVLADEADLVETLAVLTARGYTTTAAIKAMGAAARGRPVMHGDITLN